MSENTQQSANDTSVAPSPSPSADAPRMSEQISRSGSASSINYRLNEGDLGDLFALAQQRGERLLPTYLKGWLPYAAVMAVFVVLLFVCLILPQTAFLRSNPFFFASVVLASLLALLLVQRAKHAGALRPAPNGAMLRPRSIELEDDGFMVTESGSQSACLWANVLEVVENDRLVALFIDANFAHVVPKQAFATPSDARRFAAYCRERVYLAQSQ